MKLKEQRDSLREAKSAKLQELNQKQQQFAQSQAQATSRALAAEEQALLAKLPEWRNSEKAQVEKTGIANWLASQGYSQPEIASLSDHRSLMIARKAWLYDQLQAGKADKLKQARTASPVAKPGAQVSSTEKNATGFKAKLQDFRTAGRKGNNKAQEVSLTQMLERTFK
jgi:hypothetical protein